MVGKILNGGSLLGSLYFRAEDFEGSILKLLPVQVRILPPATTTNKIYPKGGNYDT